MTTGTSLSIRLEPDETLSVIVCMYWRSAFLTMIAFDELYELKSELEAILTNNTIDELLNHQRTTALSDLYIKVQMLVASEAKNSVRV